MSARETLSRIKAHAKGIGWKWRHTNGGHLQFTKDGCQPVFVSRTPSDRRALKNAICMLNRENAACTKLAT